ncbi:MAG: ChrR family anti-sigma-E factor [Cellvibrionaceae bacterium]
MTQHHPSNDLLAEFSSGTLDTAQAVAISAHLHFCHKCRCAVQEMEQVAGAMLEELSPQVLPEAGFDDLMAAIDKKDQAITVSTEEFESTLPRAVTRMTSDTPLKWRKVTNSLKTATLTAGQNQYEVSLQKIQAGGTVPKHDHRGMEMTVVLKGSFSDKQGIYQEGDFLIKQPGDIHQPVSARHEDCLCLSIQAAPVKLTGLLGKLMNPFIRLRTA